MILRAYTLLRPNIPWYPVTAEPARSAVLRQYELPFTYDLVVEVPDGQTAVAAGWFR